MLEVRLLGTFDINCDGKPVIISSRIAQSLFAYLIINAGTSYRREKLAGMFWPDTTEEKARAYLRHEIWRIRKVLAPKSKVNYLLADDINISFNASAEYWLDVATLANIRKHETAEELIKALSVFSGELLPGFYEDWVVLEREHLQAVYEQKIARLLELLEGENRWNDILDWAERWISFGQAPEEAYRYLMIAYDALGDRAKVASTYERCVQALREIGLEPSEQTRALAFKRSSKMKVPVPLTSFIGREKELKEVTDLFSKSRLVTLTGSGGVGKTRLAIQVVAEVLELFPDGVWFLDLASLSDPALVPNTLAHLLGLRESSDTELSFTDLLINYFSSRTALVVFNNCEHLIQSCAQLVNSLLTLCENLSILATSREVLRVASEIPYRVPSLETPKRDIKSTVDVLAQIESVRLFTERAAVALPGFVVTLQNAPVVIQICQRLDGIPLAIELASARLNVLTVEQILKRLEDRFNLLTGGLRSVLPRYRTLRATIDWSYDLLLEKERILFRRLAVFMGGWTLEAVEAVCSVSGIESANALDLLSQLVNKSLIITEESQNGVRYRMLETIRQYANEKLVGYRESGALRDRHLEYFLNLAETAEPHLIRTEQIEWLPVLDADYENLRLALEWVLIKESAGPSLRLGAALGWFWIIRGYWLEGLSWLTRALARSYLNESKNEKIVRARALYTCALLERQLGNNFEQILSPAEASLALATKVSEKRDIAIARFLVGVALTRRGEDNKAYSLIEQSFTDFQELQEPFWQAHSFPQVGYFLLTQSKITYRDMLLQRVDLARKAKERLTLADALSDYAHWLFRINLMDEAEKYAEESDRLYKRIGSDNTSINPLLFAEIAWINGDYQKAKLLYIESYQRFSLLGEKGFKSNCIGELGMLVMDEGDLDRARAYLEEALMLEQEAGWKPWTAFYLTELSNLFYLQGNIEQFKQSFRESLSFRNYFHETHKNVILMTILGSLYFQKPEISARLLGAITSHEGEYDVPRTPVEKRYCRRAEAHCREILGYAAFESAVAEGRKMSLDEGLDLTLKTVEEM